MNIKISSQHVDDLFELMQKNGEAYVTRKWHPNAKVGDLIKFYDGGRLIAIAKIDRIIEPSDGGLSVSSDDKDAEVKRAYPNKYIIFWKRETFQIKRQKDAAGSRK